MAFPRWSIPDNSSWMGDGVASTVCERGSCGDESNSEVDASPNELKNSPTRWKRRCVNSRMNYPSNRRAGQGRPKTWRSGAME